MKRVKEKGSAENYASYYKGNPVKGKRFSEIEAFKKGLQYMATKSDEEIKEILKINGEGKYEGFWENVMLEISGERTDEITYRPVYPLLLVYHMSQGHSKESFPAVIGIGGKRFKKWVDKYPSMNMAYEIGESLRLQYWERVAQGNAEGTQKGNAAALIFALKNHYPERYKDKREIGHTGHVYHIDTGIHRQQDEPETIDAECRQIEHNPDNNPTASPLDWLEGDDESDGDDL